MSYEIPFHTICNQLDHADEEEMIKLLKFSPDKHRQRIIAALLSSGYLLDNHAMTLAGEYPYLPGKRGNTTLLRLNQSVRDILYSS